MFLMELDILFLYLFLGDDSLCHALHILSAFDHGYMYHLPVYVFIMALLISAV